MLVQLSDLHVGARTGGDPERDAAAAVRAVTALRPAPSAVLVSGDLADSGTPEQYARVRALLAGLPPQVPVHVLPGNHDDRAALRAAFPIGGEATASAADGRYRYAVRCGGLRLVACDTTVPGQDAGRLDAEHRAWLAETLAADLLTPTILALHHPPLLTGLRPLDPLAVPAQDRAPLAELLAKHPQVRRVVAGHVHVASTALLGGVPVMTAPSVWRTQPALDLEEPGWRMVDAPAGFLVHVLLDGQLVTHARTVG